MKPCPNCDYELFDYAQRCNNCGLINPHGIYNKPVKSKRGGKAGRRFSKTQQAIPKVLELKKQGGSIRQIAQQTGLARNTVRSILPPFDKHITPIARTVLDKCLAHSLKLFTKEYHNNLGTDDGDKFDAFIETLVNRLEPSVLQNQMSSWIQELTTIGDNAFVSGAIYALNKAKDYFHAIKELEPPEP